MYSPRVLPLDRLRAWVNPAAAVILCLGLWFMPDPAGVRVSQALEWTVFFPFRWAVSWGEGSLRTRMELERAQRQLAERRWEEDMCREAAAENARLRRLLGFRRRGDFDLLLGTVVGRGRGRLGEQLTILAAETGRVEPGMAVLSSDGLVGVVRQKEGEFIRVDGLNHLNVTVSIVNQRNREGGILRWRPESNELVISGIPMQADWQPGDRLVTSGLGTTFPRGILAGWVTGQRLPGHGALKTVLVRPAATGRVQEVFLMAFRPGEPGSDAGLSDLYLLEPSGRSRTVPLAGTRGPQRRLEPAP